MGNLREMPVMQKEDIGLSTTVASLNGIHQPIIAVIDNSYSMTTTEPGETHTNLKIAESMINEIGADPSLSPSDQEMIDFAVLNFHDDVEVRQNWIALSQFKRNVKIPAGGCTCFYQAVIQSILSCKLFFEQYKAVGITCKRPQIFLFTDGYPTDDENMPKAKDLCQHYLEGENPKCRLHVILLPGASDKAAKGLSSEIRTYRTKDCKHGLPAALNFINSSIVTFSSTAIGCDCQLQMDAKYMVAGASYGVINKQTGTCTVTDNAAVTDMDDTYEFVSS